MAYQASIVKQGFLGQEYSGLSLELRGRRDAQESTLPPQPLFPTHLFLQLQGTQANICPLPCLREWSLRTCLQNASKEDGSSVPLSWETWIWTDLDHAAQDPSDFYIFLWISENKSQPARHLHIFISRNSTVERMCDRRPKSQSLYC